MSLREELAEKAKAKKRKPGPRCGFCASLSRMDPEDRQAVYDSLLDFRVHGSEIAKLMRNNGFDVSTFTVNRHRRGECKEMP